MTSGPCMTLVLTKGDTGEGVLEDLRAVIGPKDVELAKTEAPERYTRVILIHVIIKCSSVCEQRLVQMLR